MEGGDQLAIAQRERGGEGTIGGDEIRDQRAIASGGGGGGGGSGGGQVGNGVDTFLLIDMVGSVLADMIGGMVDGTRGDGL